MGKVKDILNAVKELVLNNKKIAVILASIFLIIIIFWLIIAISFSRVALSCDEVEEIALKKLGGGNVTKCELERKKYEVKIVHNNYEYEFSINANTGEVLDYDGEYIGEIK